MINIDTTLTINNDDFLTVLKENFWEEYNIGIHGIDNPECWIKINNEWQLNTNRIKEIKNSILRNGLYIKGNRNLLSTVRFDDITEYLTTGYYDAGGIIIALPKIKKTSDGEQIFIGSPIDTEDITDRNYTFTSLSDMILPEYNKDNGHLNAMFILGQYEKTPNQQIRLMLNPNHIYFKNGILPREYFDLKKKQIKEIFNLYGASNVDELKITISNKKIKVK